MGHEKIFVDAGRRIAELRGALTQAAFAERLGVDRKTVVRWEAGERLPDGASLLALAREFRADVNYILTGQGEMNLKPEEVALLDNYRHSPEDQQRLLRETGAAFAKRRQGKRSA
jgi:transcriptional regulator with XRE-family HTH domain